MASVYEKNGHWYLRYRNESGRWSDKRSMFTPMMDFEFISSGIGCGKPKDRAKGIS